MLMGPTTILGTLLVCSLISHCHAESETDVRKMILNGHDNFARPRRDAKESVEVKVSFTLMKLLSLLDSAQQMSVIGFFSFTWKDDYLTWNATHTGVKSVIVRASEIWTPEVGVRDSRSPMFDVTRDPSNFLEVFSDGSVFSYPVGELKMLCPIYVRYFPYDDHICIISVGNWMLTSAKQQLITSQSEVTMRKIAAHIQWAVDGSSVQRYCYNYGVDEYDMIRIHMKLRRKSQYFVMNFMIPVYLFAIIAIGVYFVPIEQSTRMMVCMRIYLVYSFFMTVILSIIPKSSDALPLLSILVYGQMILLAISVVLEACLQWMKSPDPILDKARPLPGGSYASTTFGAFLSFCCLKELSNTEADELVVCFQGCGQNGKEEEEYEETPQKGSKSTNPGRYLRDKTISFERTTTMAIKEDADANEEAAEGAMKTWYDLAMKIERHYLGVYVFALVVLNITIMLMFQLNPPRQLPTDGKCPGFEWKASSTLGATETLDEDYQYNEPSDLSGDL